MKTFKGLLAIALVIAVQAYASTIGPEFSDTIKTPPSDEVEKGLSLQGEVYVSGNLLTTPCSLGDTTHTTPEVYWLSDGSLAVTLMMENCGVGTDLYRMKNTGLPVSVRWEGAGTWNPFLLHNGKNRLSPGIAPRSWPLKLELSYD
ncbi:hypothetical protein OLZ90_003832 [Salmonella enterica]|nr:hypothetical protein [Salmonella enterica]